MKKQLSDRTIRDLKPAVDGKPYDVSDTKSPVTIRVMPCKDDETPVKTCVLVARYGGPSSNPTRRSLGRYGTGFRLADAQAKAREWLKLIDRAGKDQPPPSVFVLKGLQVATPHGALGAVQDHPGMLGDE